LVVSVGCECSEDFTDRGADAWLRFLGEIMVNFVSGHARPGTKAFV